MNLFDAVKRGYEVNKLKIVRDTYFKFSPNTKVLWGACPIGSAAVALGFMPDPKWKTYEQLLRMDEFFAQREFVIPKSLRMDIYTMCDDKRLPLQDIMTRIQELVNAKTVS